MATKRKVSGIGAVDRSIKAKRDAMSKLRKAATEKKRLAKKVALNAKLDKQLKALKAKTGSTTRRKRR